MQICNNIFNPKATPQIYAQNNKRAKNNNYKHCNNLRELSRYLGG